MKRRQLLGITAIVGAAVMEVNDQPRGELTAIESIHAFSDLRAATELDAYQPVWMIDGYWH